MVDPCIRRFPDFLGKIFATRFNYRWQWTWPMWPSHRRTIRIDFGREKSPRPFAGPSSSALYVRHQIQFRSTQTPSVCVNSFLLPDRWSFPSGRPIHCLSNISTVTLFWNREKKANYAELNDNEDAWCLRKVFSCSFKLINLLLATDP